MDFLIANTFADSLAKLSGEDQKSTKTAVFDLQMNPANPGFKLHKLDRKKSTLLMASGRCACTLST